VRWRDVMLLFGRAAACRSPYPHKRPKKVFRAGFLSDGTNIPEIHPLGDALPERRMGAKGHEERLPAAKAECRLWVQKGDDRRNAPQRVKRADSRHLGNRELQPIAVIEARPTPARQAAPWLL